MQEILDVASKALALDPNMAEAQAAYGMASSLDDKPAEAVNAFEKAIALDPQCYEAHLYFAWHSLAHGDTGKSAILYRRAAELQPSDFRSPIYLSSVLHSLGREAESRKFALLGLERAEKAFSLHPDSSDAAQIGACVLASLRQHPRYQALEELAS